MRNIDILGGVMMKYIDWDYVGYGFILSAIATFGLAALGVIGRSWLVWDIGLALNTIGYTILIINQ
jgi:hypothetical protein